MFIAGQLMMDDCSLKMAFKAFTLTQTNGLPHSKQTWLLAFPILKANMTRPPNQVQFHTRFAYWKEYPALYPLIDLTKVTLQG
jgi:hypothetical protein